ncbi:MAG: hypothetical protein OEM15_17195 [Myxococcales bacterium]|nr:hypothetical protein [Myxococcales bacterium]MDH3484104.1 hypothetical protein [Myxococcales bacterium]
MDLQRQIEALERALGRLGIRFLEEELPQEAHIDGGLCTVEGDQVLYVSPAAPPWRRAEVLLDALRRLPHHDIWLPPEIRQLLKDQSLVDRPVRLVASAEASRNSGAREGDR